MATYVVWIDMDQAKLFEISSTEHRQPRIVRRHEIKHHTSSDPDNHKNCEKFFHEVARELSDASEILLAGPGLSKEHFKTHLERHNHLGLRNRIVGTRTVDHPTDNQILAFSRKFFRISDIFGPSIPA